MSIRADILHFLEGHKNETVFLKDLEKALPDLTAKQIQSNINNMKNSGILQGLEIITGGQVWKYNPDQIDFVEGDEIITVLQITPKESIIFQREDKSIWIARKVED